MRVDWDVTRIFEKSRILKFLHLFSYTLAANPNFSSPLALLPPFLMTHSMRANIKGLDSTPVTAFLKL